MIYEAREDSLLLQKFVKKFATGKVLDMGTGTGIQAKAASARARAILAVDVNQDAIKYCKENINHSKIRFKRSDLFRNVSSRYDLIIFNPPYLPLDKREPKDSQLATTGGKKGYETLEKFFSEAHKYLGKEGKILIVFSSLTNKIKVDSIIDKYGFVYKQLASKKLPMEKLYVYVVTKSNLLKNLETVNGIEKVFKGHRGVVFRGDLKKRTVAIKVDNNKNTINRITNEVNWLKILNNKKIGPQLISYSDDYFVMEYIYGENIWEYIAKSSKNQIRSVIKEVFHQCFTLDNLNVNKEEMHHPVKHIIINSAGVTMIDFERCRKTLHPKNVTQFCQFLRSASFGYGLENKGLIINKRLERLAQKYKHNPNKKNFEMILNEI